MYVMEGKPFEMTDIAKDETSENYITHQCQTIFHITPLHVASFALEYILRLMVKN